MIGFRTLLYKELLRFWKVGFQTVAAPVLTTLLYLLVFAHVLGERVTVYGTLPYTVFLVPGLVMMTMLQNAFANGSSSLIQSKVSGNIVFMLLPPLSYLEFFGAYVLAAMTRALVVGVGVLAATLPFVALPLAQPLWALAFALAGCAILGAMGLLAGIWSDKFEQIAAFQSFVIVPFTFLAGVFYSVHTLPALWQGISHLNPFFYMIDGFRYGFFGVSDTPPALSLAVVTVCFAVLTGATLALLKSGYKLRH